jgi:hypothetical protein
MKIGLIDVDGHNFPNLPLMKLSAYHKERCDPVEFYDPMFGGHYDIVYMSKVFTFTEDYLYPINADKIIKSGTGYYDYGGEKLNPHIEHIMPDYELYGIKDTAYGFLTRGCPRNCSFCNVSQVQGNKSIQVALLSEFWNGQKNIVLLDPNITANKNCIPLFNQLIESNAWVDFSQGLDVRLMDKEKAMLLNEMKIKTIHFAWDNYEFKTYEKLKQIRPLLDYDERKLKVYVLTNFNTTHEQDLERIDKLRELNYTPYTMIYDKKNSPTITRRMARWTNNMFIWRSCEKFEDYDK